MPGLESATVSRAGILPPFATVAVSWAPSSRSMETGRIHLIHVEYKDAQSPPDERLLGNWAQSATYLSPTRPQTGRRSDVARKTSVLWCARHVGPRFPLPQPRRRRNRFAVNRLPVRSAAAYASRTTSLYRCSRRCGCRASAVLHTFGRTCGEPGADALADELHLEHPFYGSRQMARHLHRERVVAGRNRVRRLMGLMGMEAVYRRPASDNTGRGQCRDAVDTVPSRRQIAFIDGPTSIGVHLNPT